jgi:CRISPR-associated protein Csb1
MVDSLTYSTLHAAVAGRGAAFRCRTRLQPAGGPGDKVFPPTYAGGVYAVEDRRIDGRVVRCVLLDSVQSQANRMEEAFQDAFLPNWRELRTDGDDPQCDLPVVAVHVENHGWVTSLTAPHRIHDAILRDSNLDGLRFRDSDVGRTLVKARLHNAMAFYRYCPTVLLFGTWDSTAGEGLDSAKVPRAVVSEIIGVDITAGVRTGSRIDPLGIARESATIYRRADNQDDWTLDRNEAARDANGGPVPFGSGQRRGGPAAINHGNIPPDMPRFERKDVRDCQLDRLPDVLASNPIRLRYDLQSGDGRLESRTVLVGQTVRIRDGAVKPGGVTMAYALHTWTLSLTQLRRLQFPVDGKHDEERNKAARTVLTALALYAFALQQERGYWLRSRCELIPQAGKEQAVTLEQINADGTTTGFVAPNRKNAEALLREACEKAREAFTTNSGSSDAPQAQGANALPNPGWEQRVIRLTPTDKLVELVKASDARQPAEDDDAQQTEEEPEEEETADAGTED